MPADGQLRALWVRLAALVRSTLGTAFFVSILLLATLDGHFRHALGLVHDGPEGAIWIHNWCRRILRLLGIKCTVEGDLPGQQAAFCEGFEAVVCNHLSYIDILLLASIRPFIMVAKTEVRSWPLLGWLTAQAGTVYVQRGGKPETYPAVNAAMAQAYRSGLPVIFFPEGTTTDGSEVLPFRRGLFHSVLRDSVQVRTAALTYGLDGNNPNATTANDVCWWGDADFVPHLFRLLALRGLHASVLFGPAVQGADRFELSQNAHAAVSTLYMQLTSGSSVCAGVPLTRANQVRPQAGMAQAL